MHWGYILVWMPDYLKLDEDPLFAKLKWLERYGLESTGVGLKEIMQWKENRLHEVADYLAEKNLSLTIYGGVDFLHPDVEKVRRDIDEAIRAVEKFRQPLRTRLVQIGVASTHRFARDPNLQQQMERLAAVLPPYAEAVAQMGLPMGIENHGDYYCSDLVSLCQQVPHLGIFLDTGNTYLIGEAPLPAFEAAALYVVGGHFKDHHVRPCPEARPLHFEVDNSVIGEGDVPLRELYALLKAKCPNFDRLVFEIEYIPPSDIGQVEGFERSVNFVRSLDGGQ